jgi:hypothetical protein
MKSKRRTELSVRDLLGVHVQKVKDAKLELRIMKPKKPFKTLPIPDISRLISRDRDFARLLKQDSAKALLDRLAKRLKLWFESCPPDRQPMVFVYISDGTAIRVKNMWSEGRNGVVVEGFMGDDPCMVVSHVASLHVVCVIAKVEKDQERRIIGFGPG